MSSLAYALTESDVQAARKVLAKRSVSDFACMVDIPTVPLSDAEDEDDFSVLRLNSLVDHHRFLCGKLQDVADGIIPNLMVLMPPGSAKSTYSDVVFIPWFMARQPRRNVILASYASDIAKKQGRRARQLIQSKSFVNLMDVTLKDDQKAADEWALSNGSEYMAGGLLSGLTGNRAGLGVLDDPIKGREAAESETIRQKTWEAYIDDFCSRLIPGAPQVMILTRWHEDDPAGRILPEGWDGESGLFDGRDGRKWYVICLPAIADRKDDPLGRKIGETLWPQWFNMEHWAPFQRNQRTWSSLYQQKPSPAEGTYFQRDWFKFWQKRPEHLHYYLTSDYATKEGEGDYTEHALWGICANGDPHLIDGWFGQATADVWIDEGLNLVRRYNPLCWFGESGVIKNVVEPYLRRRMIERSIHCRLEWLPSIHDKPTRARPFQAMAALGRVQLPDTPYGQRCLSQMLTFPAGRNDDFIDAASLIGRAIDMAHPAIVPPKTERQQKFDYGTNDDDDDDGVSWKTA